MLAPTIVEALDKVSVVLVAVGLEGGLLLVPLPEPHPAIKAIISSDASAPPNPNHLVDFIPLTLSS
jgi:hypothetical protein